MNVLFKERTEERWNETGFMVASFECLEQALPEARPISALFYSIRRQIVFIV
jgi:hypothetical protein